MTTKPKLIDLQALIGNPDAYAVQHDDGSYHPVREPLSPAVLRQHRAGDITVGTYIVKGDQARTLVFDIDAKAEAEQNVMLKKVTSVLRDININQDWAEIESPVIYWATEVSGRKGYHVWIVAEDYMPAETLYRLGRGIREEAGYPAMEVFPKQTEARDLGSLVKLPGGFHAVTGKANDFIGAPPKPNSVEALTALAALYPEVGLRPRRADAPAVMEYPCVYDIQSGVKEGGRNIHLFHLAVMLRKWSLTDENVEAVVRRANEASVDGPLPEEELLGLLANSCHSGPVCAQLDEGVHCGDQCILARHDGLYVRPGSVKWAADGEVVTVEIKSRTEDGLVVEIEHPDIVQGRAILAEPKPKRKTKES